ncbi:MAG: gliding motility-associated ABC transporter permease subunit GldF [Bacteroidota bacterium]
MYTLFVREINNFFNNLIGYITIAVFLIINSLFLWVFPVETNILNSGYANLEGLFSIGPYVFLFLIPAITMRFFADENKSGTIEFLLTKPLTDLQIVLAKYFAAVVLVVISLLPALLYVITVYRYGLPPGNLDMGATWGSFIGLLFLGAVFVSIGLFSSALTDNSIVSFMISIFLCGFIYIGFEFIYSLDFFGNFDLFIRDLGIFAHYTSISRGVIDSRDVIYFLSVIVVFLLLTKIKLESRKWEK